MRCREPTDLAFLPASLGCDSDYENWIMIMMASNKSSWSTKTPSSTWLPLIATFADRNDKILTMQADGDKLPSQIGAGVVYLHA